MQKFAVFVSGHGSNLQAIIDAVKNKDIKADLALVFSDNPKAFALKRAQGEGIKTIVLRRQDYAAPQSYDRDIVMNMKREDIDFIVLAGYMKLLTPFFVKEYKNKILNIHPSLLPSFKGKKAIKDTFTYGAKVAGVTIHIVNEKMDNGPIIVQEGFKVAENDTVESLEEKIHKIEHKLYPKAIKLFIEGRLKITGRKVKVSDRAKKT